MLRPTQLKTCRTVSAVGRKEHIMTPLRKKRIIERPPLTHDIVGVLHERDQSLVDLLVLKRALVHHRQHLQNQHDGNMCDIYDLTIRE